MSVIKTEQTFEMSIKSLILHTMYPEELLDFFSNVFDLDIRHKTVASKELGPIPYFTMGGIDFCVVLGCQNSQKLFFEFHMSDIRSVKLVEDLKCKIDFFCYRNEKKKSFVMKVEIVESGLVVEDLEGRLWFFCFE